MDMQNFKRRIQGARNRAEGLDFEERLNNSFLRYREAKLAVIEKNSEPVRQISPMNEKRQFLACYTKKARPDYEGTVKGGRSVVIEAKFTSTDQMQQSRVKKQQADYLSESQALGARCYVVIGFSSGSVYRIPWSVWADMKNLYGRKYLTEKDIKEYRVPTAKDETLLVLN